MVSGEADPKVQELTGLKNYNIKIKLSFVIEDESAKDGDNKLPEFIDSGILYENGNKCVLKGEEFFPICLIFSFHDLIIQDLQEFLN